MGHLIEEVVAAAPAGRRADRSSHRTRRRGSAGEPSAARADHASGIPASSTGSAICWRTPSTLPTPRSRSTRTGSKDEVRIVIADDGSGFPPMCSSSSASRSSPRGRPRLPSGGAGRAYRHGARLLHRQDVARTVRRDARARQPRPNRQAGAVVTVAWPRSQFERMSEKPIRPSLRT